MRYTEWDLVLLHQHKSSTEPNSHKFDWPTLQLGMWNEIHMGLSRRRGDRPCWRLSSAQSVALEIFDTWILRWILDTLINDFGDLLDNDKPPTYNYCTGIALEIFDTWIFRWILDTLINDFGDPLDNDKPPTYNYCTGIYYCYYYRKWRYTTIAKFLPPSFPLSPITTTTHSFRPDVLNSPWIHCYHHYNCYFSTTTTTSTTIPVTLCAPACGSPPATPTPPACLPPPSPPSAPDPAPATCHPSLSLSSGFPSSLQDPCVYTTTTTTTTRLTTTTIIILFLKSICNFLSYVQTPSCHFSENLIVSKNLVSRHWWRQMSIATDKLMALQSIQHIQGQTKSFYIATPTQHT